MSEIVRVPGAVREVQVAGREPVLDVVFLHGLDGHHEKTWRTKPSDTYWPTWLAEDNEAVDVWSVRYDAWSSGYRGQAMSMQDRAVNLLALMRGRGIGSRPVCFVGHSLGGLIIKQMLFQATTTTDRYGHFATMTKGIAFLSTPHTGSALAQFVDNLRRLYRPTPLIRALLRNDPYLRFIDNWFRDWATKQRIPMAILYETRDTRGLRVVDESSANPGIPGQLPVPVDADHISIAKPRNRESVVYTQVNNLVGQLVREERGNSPPPLGTTDPAELALTDSDARTMVKILSRVPAAEDYSAVFHAATEYRHLAAGINTLDASVRYLRELAEPYYLFAFLEHLASRSDDTLRRELREWSDRHAPSWVRDPERLHDLRTRLQSVAVAERPHIVLGIEHDVLDPDLWSVQAWACQGTSTVALTAGELDAMSPVDARNACLRIVQSHLTPPAPSAMRPLVVFSVAPDLLNWPFDSWEIEVNGAMASLGVVHPVVVRLSRSYLNPEDLRRKAAWTYAAGTDHFERVAIRWVEGGAAGAVEPPNREQPCLAVVDREVAGRPHDIADILRCTGATIAVWHRGERTRRRYSLETVLQSGSLAELPDTVLRFRCAIEATNGTAEPVGAAIVLLWDDPFCPAASPARLAEPEVVG